MSTTYGRKKSRQHYFFYTVVTALLLCMVFFATVSYFYTKAEEEELEMLHLQTKQIKDDLILQIKSDRENLITMANFAAKLYAGGEDYDIMFASFKPIGLLSNIGILTPDNVFVTKTGKLDLNGKLSFEEEAALGGYISGRIKDITVEGREIIRSAVPIVVEEEIVGILYGIIELDAINSRYNNMAKELDAQLFVFHKPSGDYLIDTIHKNPGNISELKSRKFNDNYSYEKLITTDKGFTSFRSIFKNEDMYLHYSTLEGIGWGIMLGRYESQVFEDTHDIAKLLAVSFTAIVLFIVLYLIFILTSERRRAATSVQASEIRKLLLDLNQQNENIYDALKRIQDFASSKSAFFADTDGEDYSYIDPEFYEHLICGDDRKYLIGVIFKYAADFHSVNKQTIGFMSIRPNSHLIKTDKALYDFFVKHGIDEVAFASITDKNNHVCILGTINPEKSSVSRVLLEDIAICFSIAIYNKKHLNQTEVAATTDALTGVLNRVAFKMDIVGFDREKPEKFSCIYVDVNELHLRNNKYGHAAGDEMLVYIANSLKEVFYGNHVYRMGGDEFLVFAENIDEEYVAKKIEIFVKQLQPKDYHVAIGTSFREKLEKCEEMVKEAEVKMYEAKAQYYQTKEEASPSQNNDSVYTQTKTGIVEIDTMISVVKEHYNGIYKVSLDTDSVHGILMSSYLGDKEDESGFSKLLTKYAEESVDPDFHRALLSLLNYDAVKSQLAEGKTPQVTYNKTNGESVILSVYMIDNNNENINETLWVFAKA